MKKMTGIMILSMVALMTMATPAIAEEREKHHKCSI